MRKCPQCGSRKARPSHRRELERWMAALQVRPFRCRKCHRRFWWLDPLSVRGTDFGPLVPAILALAAAGGVALYMAALPYAGEASATLPGAGVAAERPVAASSPAARAPTASDERRFGGVETLEDEDRRLRLKLKTDRPPAAWSHFFLSRPPSYAVDFEGRWAVPENSSTFLNHPLVQRVRAGLYDGALRVAIELGPVASAEPAFAEAADGLIVTFRRSED